MAQSNYSPEQAVQIAVHYRTLAGGLRALSEGFAVELQRALALVASEVRDESFARVLVAGELMRGINKDERQPVSSSAFVLSGRLRDSLRIAYCLGLAVAPFTLTEHRGLLDRWFKKPSPRLDQKAKEAILRIAAAHAASRNSARMLSLAPPQTKVGKASPAALLGRR